MNNEYWIEVDEDIVISVEGIQEIVEITQYKYYISLDDTYKDYIDSNEIPAYFSFDSKQLEKIKDNVVAMDEFIIKTSFDEEISFLEFVEMVEEVVKRVYYTCEIASINAGDEEFMSWDDEDKLTINTDLINSKNLTLVIVG